MGFTIANACYPMSMADDADKQNLDAVYAAASPDRVVCFTRTEKALLDTIPRFRPKIRIFSPLTSLYVLQRSYARPGTGSPVPNPPGPIPAGGASTSSLSTARTATPIPAATGEARTWAFLRPLMWLPLSPPPSAWPATGNASGTRPNWAAPWQRA